MKLIVGQYALYIAQMPYAAQVIIFTKRTDWEDAMYVIIMGFVLFYYVPCVCFLCMLGNGTYREIERIKIWIVPCFNCLCSCYIDPVKRTKVTDKEMNNLIKKSF